MSSEHDWQKTTVRGRESRQLRCTKCGLWETELSRMKPCGQPWDEFIQGVPEGGGCTQICGREPEGEHAKDCPHREGTDG